MARPLAVRYYLAAPHYRSTLEYHDGSLAEAEAAIDRIEGFLRRRAERRRTSMPTSAELLPDDSATRWTTTSASSGALAVVHDTVRAGNTALDDGDPDAAAAGRPAGRGA